MYGTSIEPIPGLDPRWNDRQSLNKVARDALKAAGINPNFDSNDLAAVERHAARMNAVLEPLGRNALISKVRYL